MQSKLNIKLIDWELSKRKLNRTGFAHKLNISRSLLSYYINNPSLKSIEIIANELRMNPKDLIL